MSELRDRIAQEIYESTTADEHGESQAIADAILAAVAEALTSPEAVEAACVHRWHGNARRFATYAHKQDVRDSVKGEMYAALRAAGVKGEGA